MVKLFFALFVFLGGFISPSIAEEVRDLRKLLVDSENTKEVYVIDDYHTYVVPKYVSFGSLTGEPTEELSREIAQACSTRMELDSRALDPITNKEHEVWIPYTGKEYIFHRWIYDKMKITDVHLYKARCVDQFEIAQTYTSDSYKKGAVKRFVIRHANKQPYLYKSKVLTEDKIQMLPDGEFRLNQGSSLGNMFSAIAGNASDDDAALFQFATTLCRRNNGVMRFVIGTKEAGIMQAFDYAVTSHYRYTKYGTYKDKIILYSCEADGKFIIRFEEQTKVDRNYNKSNYIKSYFANNRGLEGVSFQPLTK